MIDETYARIYRDTVGKAGAEGIPREEAFEVATKKILAGINAGVLALDEEAAVRAALKEIDNRDGKAADRILKAAATGDIPMIDADLTMVVTLGGGLRKQWSDITAEDLRRMDDLRYQNVASAQAAYAQWRRSYGPVLEALFEYGGTFGDALRAGAFDALDVDGAA